MYEMTFKITALIEEDESGRHVFKVYESAKADTDLWFYVITTFHQDLYRPMWAGDILTVTFHTPTEEDKIVAHFREDKQWGYAFDVEGQEPSPDLAVLESIYEAALQKLHIGETLTITFYVCRV